MLQDNSKIRKFDNTLFRLRICGANILTVFGCDSLKVGAQMNKYEDCSSNSICKYTYRFDSALYNLRIIEWTREYINSVFSSYQICLRIRRINEKDKGRVNHV
jgi:hypothetical protein